jgi:hypothetical protein
MNGQDKYQPLRGRELAPVQWMGSFLGWVRLWW